MTPAPTHSPVDGGAAKVSFKVTPEMQAAWVDYDPVHDLMGNRSLVYISAAMRHAFLCGYLAAERDARGAK